MKISRRDFLKWSGGTAVAAGVLHRPLSSLLQEDATLPDWSTGVESTFSTACTLCPAGCGIRVRIVDGKAVSLEGNTLHPITRGGICAKGLSGLHILYSPERIQTPLKKVGDRETGRWQPVSWEEAIQAVAKRLQEFREQVSPQSMVFLDGRPFGLMHQLIHRFTQAYGTPNHIADFYGDGMSSVVYAMQGIRSLPAYDFARSNYILSFGASLMEAGWSPVGFARAYGEFRQGSGRKRGKLVQVDTRFSATAAKADEWLPIRPNAYSALALGIAYVIVKEGLIHQNFINTFTEGFEQWKAVVLEEGRPERVSSVTGIPVDRIFRVAREFATHSPAVAVAGYEASSGTSGFYAGMCIHSLNALVGSIDVPGGVRFEPPAPFPELEIPLDEIAKRSLSHPRIDSVNRMESISESHPFALSQAILSSTPYPVSALFLYYSNPLYSHPNPNLFREAIQKVPLLVSFSPFMDETTALSDFVLPDHTYLERWQDVPYIPNTGTPVVSLAQPVVKPLYDTRHTGDVLLSLARAIGGVMANAFPWETYEDYLKWNFHGLYESHSGTPFLPPLELEEIRRLEEAGFSKPAFTSFDDFWDALVKSGGWVDPVYFYNEWNRIFQTPSRKFEFVSSLLRSAFESAFQTGSKKGQTVGEVRERLLTDWKITARDERLFMPHDEFPPLAGEGEFLLNPFKPYTLSTGSLCNLPFLYEILGFLVNSQWECWLELHPIDAEKLGLQNEEKTWLRLGEKRWSCRVRVTPGAQPGVVNLPFGFGHRAYSAFSTGMGANAFDLLEGRLSPLTGLPELYTRKVRIEKAE